MKKYSIISLILVALCLCSLVGCGGSNQRKAEGTIPYAFESVKGYGYEASSTIIDGEDARIYYTVNQKKNKPENVIATRKGNTTNGLTFEEQVVCLTANAEGWDKYNLNNADVIPGEFKYGGEDYKYLMAYEANNIESYKRLQIGFAVSKDGVNFVKVGDSPIVSYDYNAYGDTVGVCYPSLVNINGKGNVMLFYTFASALVTESRFIEIKADDLDHVVTSGAISVPTVGLPLDGNMWAVITNADYAYDSTTDEIYIVKDGFPYATQNSKKAVKIELGRIARNDMYEQNASWQVICSALDGITMGSYSRIYSAEFITNGSGVIDGANLEIMFTSGVAAKDIEDESYLYLSGIHYFEIDDTLREDI